MPAFKKTISVPGLKKDEIYARVKTEVGRAQEKLKDSTNPLAKFDVNFRDEICEVGVKAKLFSGSLTFRDGQVEATFDLSILATPFRSQIDEQIDRWVTRAFPGKGDA